MRFGSAREVWERFDSIAGRGAGGQDSMTSTNRALGSSSESDAFVTHGPDDNRAGRPAEGTAADRSMIAAGADVAENHAELGNLLLEQGKLAEAATEYERAVALNPSVVLTRNNLGCILRRLGKLDRA